MTITITAPELIPELSYDKIHIDSFSLVQKRQDNIADVKREVNVNGVIYAQELDGTQHYSGTGNLQGASNDFDGVAVADYIANNAGATVADALAAYAAAKAAVQTEYDLGTLDTFKLMAYFEMAIGHTIKLLNVENISGIE